MKPRQIAITNGSHTDILPTAIKNCPHNYLIKFQWIASQWKSIKGLHLLDIMHDDWCGIHGGGYCNCDPDFLCDGKRVPAPPIADILKTARFPQ